MFALFLLAVLPLVIFGVPQNCNKLFVSRFYEYYDIGNLTVSANIEFINGFHGIIIIVSNVSVDGDVNLGVPDSICVNVETGENGFQTSDACSSSLNATFSFPIEAPSFNLEIHFSNSYFFLYYGYADNGTFSYEDGSLFSPNNPTFTYISDQAFYHDVQTQTCTAFIPAPIAPTNSSKCKTFKSQVLILNSDDNYSIYGTSYMEWSLNDDKIEADGNYTIPGGYSFYYNVNDEEDMCNSAGCSFTLKPGDKKLIISAAAEKRMGFDFITIPVPMVGRIIFRDGQILMGEGIPFSPKDDCLYFNFPFTTTQVSTNKFCCTEFEDS